MRLREAKALVPAAPSVLRLPAFGFVIVYAVLLLCVPSQLIFRPLGSPGTPANIIGLGALVWWLAGTLGGLNPVKRFTPTRIVVLLLTCAVIASYVNAMLHGWYAPPDVRQQTDEFWTLVPPTVGETTASMVKAADRGLLAFSAWMGIVLMTAEGLRSWADVDRVVEWVSWLATLVATLGILQFFTGLNLAAYIVIPGLSANSEIEGVVGRSVLNRVSGTAVHPIEYGVVLAAVMPLVLHRTIHHWGRPLALLPLVVVFVGCFLSVSRSAVLVVLVALLVLMFGWSNRRRLRALVILPFAVVGLRLAIPGLVGTLMSLFKNLFNDPSVTGRTSDYDVVFRVMGDNLIFGRGFFTFIPRYYRILDNQYLVFGVELGLFGLMAVLVLLVGCFFAARTVYKHAQTSRARDLGLSLSASILGLTISFATFDALGFPMAAGLTMLMIGLIGATWRLTVLEDPASPYRPDAERSHEPA